jgi:hypothetical protein
LFWRKEGIYEKYIREELACPAAAARECSLRRRPIAAFGNSDGDLQMLRLTTAGRGARLALIVHHTDAEREWAYDRPSSVGQLDKALDEARAKGWMVVNTKNDWKKIFSWEK